MSVKFEFEGGRKMERALAQLPRSTAKGVVRRTLKKTLEPVRDAADAFTGEFNIAVTSRLSRRQRRAARADFLGNVVSMYVGPTQEDGSHAPHAHLIEFGTGPRFHQSGKFVGAVSPDPFMRPAWDMHRRQLPKRLGELLWMEIEKSLARAAARAGR